MLFSATSQKVYQLRNDTAKTTFFLVPIDSMDRVKLPAADGATIKHYKTLTIENVKACIGFQKESEVYRSLSGLCDVWYSVAKQQGKTDEQAAEAALLSLGEKVKELIR